jgi:thiosulfate/3-mercaptopyruvate sulfurtransferase
MTTAGSNVLAQAPGNGASALATSEWLAGHLFDPTVRVVEVDVSRANYDQGHIHGAMLWNVYQDLKDAEYRPVDTSGLERLIARSAISSDSTVVFYGYAPAMAFWLMKLHGHSDVRILDSSRDAWRASGLPWTNSAGDLPGTGYRLGEMGAGLRADHSAVRNAMSMPRATIADVRSEAEYRGERFWPSGGLEPNGRAGHIPGAIHQPIDGLYDERGSFRPPADLRGVFASIDLECADEVITYCTIGGRACTAWFVLTYLLGRDNVRVYDGSWAEWGFMAGSPVERDPVHR